MEANESESSVTVSIKSAVLLEAKTVVAKRNETKYTFAGEWYILKYISLVVLFFHQLITVVYTHAQADLQLNFNALFSTRYNYFFQLIATQI